MSYDETGLCAHYLHLAHPHLLVRATNNRFLLARATFRSVLASERNWLQAVLVLTVRWWPAPISVGGLIDTILGSNIIAIEKD